LKDIVLPAKRGLQEINLGNIGGDWEPFSIGPEEIEICCMGNGDFDFVTRDVDYEGLAVATEAEGFLQIPGGELQDSQWL